MPATNRLGSFAHLPSVKNWLGFLDVPCLVGGAKSTTLVHTTDKEGELAKEERKSLPDNPHNFRELDVSLKKKNIGVRVKRRKGHSCLCN